MQKRWYCIAMRKQTREVPAVPATLDPSRVPIICSLPNGKVGAVVLGRYLLCTEQGPVEDVQGGGRMSPAGIVHQVARNLLMRQGFPQPPIPASAYEHAAQNGGHVSRTTRTANPDCAHDPVTIATQIRQGDIRFIYGQWAIPDTPVSSGDTTFDTFVHYALVQAVMGASEALIEQARANAAQHTEA